MRDTQRQDYEDEMEALTKTIESVSAAIATMQQAQKTTDPEDTKMMLAQQHVKKVVSLVSVSSSLTRAEIRQLRAFADAKEPEFADRKRFLDQRLEERRKRIRQDLDSGKVTPEQREAMLKELRDVDQELEALEGLVDMDEGKRSEAIKTMEGFEDQRVAADRARAERLAGRPDQLAKGDLAAHIDKYDFKSENVIELLKVLEAKFTDEKQEAVKGETNARFRYDLALDARTRAIAAAKTASAKRADERARVQRIIGETQQSLENANSDKEVDSKTLEDTQQECRVRLKSGRSGLVCATEKLRRWRPQSKFYQRSLVSEPRFHRIHS